MIGFRDLSARESFDHLKSLVRRVPDKYHPEIELMYEWMTDVRFRDALACNRPENWAYCRKSMNIAPHMFIDRNLKGCGAFEPMVLEYPNVEKKDPVCRLCCTSLGTKYCAITCTCGTMSCHVKCGEKYLLEEQQCYVCKNYYIYEKKC